jgi:hypothetical protein
MTKQKLLLIAGCSHTSGSEIDGEQDSLYNRQHSYGNVLAAKLGYTPINIAEPASTNPTIARSVLQWFSEEYNKEEMEMFVLIGWTEVTRLEAPYHRICPYSKFSPYGDYSASTGTHYQRINMGYPGGNEEEKVIISEYHRFMAKNEKYLELTSANLILQLQYFLCSIGVGYLMCNTLHMFDTRDNHNTFYLNQIDHTKYYNVEDNTQSFYTKYKELGYKNDKAKYWHHNEVPHSLYADELYNFIKDSINDYSKMV